MTGARQSSPLSLLVATLASLLWLAAAGWVLFRQGLPADPQVLLTSIALTLTPIAVPFALVAALRSSASPMTALSDLPEAVEAEQRLADIASRIGTISEYLTETTELLGQSGETLAAHGDTVRSLASSIRQEATEATNAGTSLIDGLTKANEQANLYHQSIRQASELTDKEAQHLSDATVALGLHLSEVAEQTTAAHEKLADMLSALDTKGAEHLASVSEASQQMLSASEAAFERTATALEVMRDGLDAQVTALGAQMTEIRANIDQIGGEAQRTITNRLQALGQQIDALEAQMAAQVETSNSLGSTAEHNLKLLDARLAHSVETSTSALKQIRERIAEADSAISALSPALREGQTTTEAFGKSVTSLRENVMQTIDAFGQTLPEKAVDATRATETVTAELKRLSDDTDQLMSKIHRLSDPVAESRSNLAEAGEALDQQRKGLEMAGHALMVELEQARQLISTVEQQANDSSLSAASGLVDALNRVNEVAAQATGRMRQMIEDVIEEARSALNEAATDSLRHSFLEPIQSGAEEASRLASTAAERSASSMAALASTLALLDEQSSRKLAVLEEAEQQHLLAAASLLGQELNLSVAELADTLSLPQETRGRGIFGGLLRKLSGSTSPLQKQLDENPELKVRAERYANDFSALLNRVAGHDILVSALEQSEQGRLAAIIRQALTPEQEQNQDLT